MESKHEEQREEGERAFLLSAPRMWTAPHRRPTGAAAAGEEAASQTADSQGTKHRPVQYLIRVYTASEGNFTTWLKTVYRKMRAYKT